MKLTFRPPGWLRRVLRPPGGQFLLAVPVTAPPLAAHQISQVINATTVWLMGILGGLATLFLTIGAVRYIMASTDPAEVEKAKSAWRNAAIGYGLAVLAPVIVAVLKSLVGG